MRAPVVSVTEPVMDRRGPVQDVSAEVSGVALDVCEREGVVNTITEIRAETQ